MWMEALKVCRDYLPSKLAAVEADYEREVGSRAFRDAGAIFSEATQWEQNGQYLSAVNAYLKACKEYFLHKLTKIHLVQFNANLFSLALQELEDQCFGNMDAFVDCNINFINYFINNYCCF